MPAAAIARRECIFSEKPRHLPRPRKCVTVCELAPDTLRQSGSYHPTWDKHVLSLHNTSAENLYLPVWIVRARIATAADQDDAGHVHAPYS